MRRPRLALHTGILEGWGTFANVMKYLLMGTSANFGNMFSMAWVVLFLLAHAQYIEGFGGLE